MLRRELRPCPFPHGALHLIKQPYGWKPRKDRPHLRVSAPKSKLTRRMNPDFVEPRTPLQKVLGTAMWVPGLTWLTMGMGTLMVLQRFLPSHRIEPLTRIYTRGQIVAAGSRLRHVVHPDVDPKGVYMFAQNHVNLLDHCTMYNSTPHFKQGIELAAHFKLPVYGWFM